MTATDTAQPDQQFWVLLVDRPSSWLDNLKKAIEEEGHHVDVRPDVRDVDLSPYHLVAFAQDPVVDPAHQPIDDVLNREGAPSTRNSHFTTQKVVAIHGVPHQTQLSQHFDQQKLLRNVGVKAFLYRDENIGRCVAIVSALLYQEKRANVRVPVKYKARIRQGEGEYMATIVDIGVSGVQTVLRRWQSTDMFVLGASIAVQWRSVYDHSEIRCEGTIRRVRPQRSIFGNRLALGVQFAELNTETRAALQAIVDYESEVLEIQRLTALGVHPEIINITDLDPLRFR
jgi:hypothetical protein